MAKIGDIFVEKKTGNKFIIWYDPDDGHPRPFRVATVLSAKGEPGGKSGRTCTEKFRASDNSHIVWRTKRRGLKILPWRWLRRGRLWISICDSSTGEIARNAIQQGAGKITVKPTALPFLGFLEKGRAVVQNGGAFYLEIVWGSLIKRWEVEVLSIRRPSPEVEPM